MDKVAEELKNLHRTEEVTGSSLTSTGLSLRHRAELRKAITPLSYDKRGTPSELKDLEPFWEEVVKCFRGLGSTLNVDALGRRELSELVPEVLGAPIWAIIKADDT